MADDETLEISKARLQGVIDVLSLLAIGEYDPALSRIQPGTDESPLSFLEASLDIFVRELADARRENQAYVDKLEETMSELEEKLLTIERQRVAIRELSTPIIELWDQILTLPIVGVVDSQRSIEMTEQLLSRLSAGNFRCVIIDVTGVEVIDTMTADHFAKMIRAAQLLGTYCVVTGLSANLSQTIVEIGIDLGPVETLRTLKEGLRHCLRHLRASGKAG